MQKKKSLCTLECWNSLAITGEVDEPTFSAFHPNTGIECPNIIDDRGRVCKAHIWDIPLPTVDLPFRTKMVGCQVCGWTGYRIISTKRRNGLNGSGYSRT